MSFISANAQEWAAQMHSTNEEGRPEPTVQHFQTRETQTTIKLAVADTYPLRTWGMIDRDFDEFDGMIFMHELPTRACYHGKGIRRPLRVYFYDNDGGFVGFNTINVGEQAVPTPEFQYAIEVPFDSELDSDLRSGLPIPHR